MSQSLILKKSAKIATLLSVAILLVTLFASAALALNYSGNKSLNFNGYQYVDTTTVHVFFDKSMTTTGQADVSMFTVKDHATSANVDVSSISVNDGTGYSGCSDSGLNKGTRVTISLGSALSYDTLYDVTIKNTLADNNGITLGNYSYRNDFTFTFRTPQSDGHYSNTTPVVTYTLGTSNVSYEANLGVIFDRPMASGSVSTFLGSLSSNFYNNTKSATVVQDSTIDTNAVSGAECYTPHANDAATYFFFPQTGNGSTTTSYNRDYSGSNSYTLTVPSFTDVDSHTSSNPGSLTFSTVSGDLPGWLDNTPAYVAGDPDTLTVQWNASTITPVATQFDVYYWNATADPSNTQYNATYTLDNLDSVTGSGPYSITINSLTSGDDYYIRIVPKNSYGTVGYSRALNHTAD